MSDHDITIDHGQLAQRAAEERLNALDDNLLDDVPLPPGIEPVAPYCGCRTCEVREILAAAWPFLLDAARGELETQREARER